MSTHFAWVTDIPAPYRNHQFERMVEIFPRHDVTFEVHFMAWTQRGRPWKFAPEDLRYPWVLHRNPVPSLGERGLHVNPGLVTALRRGVDVVMVGGWGSPTHALLPFLLPRRVATILGCESHLDSVERSHPLARAVKHAIVHRYDAYLVPGARSRALLCSLDAAVADKPMVELPNLIDARLFRDRVATLRRDREAVRAALGVPAGRRLWFCPARLLPVKGLRELLPLLRGLAGIELWIAGDGELRAELDAMIARDRLPVRMLGQQPEARMIELYAAADLFVLPSLSDPSPLSAVEAAAAELPLLLSTHAGNCDDLVTDGVNGWRFDVDAPAAARRALLERVAATSRDGLAAMGQRSGRRYAEGFDSDTCVHRLAEFVAALPATSARKAKVSRAQRSQV